MVKYECVYCGKFTDEKHVVLGFTQIANTFPGLVPACTKCATELRKQDEAGDDDIGQAVDTDEE